MTFCTYTKPLENGDHNNLFVCDTLSQPQLWLISHALHATQVYKAITTLVARQQPTSILRKRKYTMYHKLHTTLNVVQEHADTHHMCRDTRKHTGTHIKTNTKHIHTHTHTHTHTPTRTPEHTSKSSPSPDEMTMPWIDVTSKVFMISRAWFCLADEKKT